MSRFLTAATLVTAARALAFDGRPARATQAVVPDATFRLPEITEAPSIKELLKRQSSSGDQTVLIGPDNTCGYVSGRAGAPITCNNDYTCAFIIQEDFGRAGCCQGDYCGLRATCYDYQQVYSSSACDDGCLQDTFTLKCTESTAPYCNTITFFSGIEDFLCASLDISTPQQLYTTYIGETDGRTFEEVTLSATDSGTDSFNSATDDGSFVLSFTSSAAESSNTDTPTGSGGSGSNGGNNNDNNGSDNDNSSGNSTKQTKSSTPIGPIVGGVVGGVGGLALIGLAIFFIVRHSNKKKRDAAASAPPMQQTPGAGGAAQPPPGAPGYPPQQGYNGAPAYDQPPYQQHPTPPQQGYYPSPEQKPGGFVSLTPTGVPDRNDSTSPVSQFSSDARHSVQQPQSPTSTLSSNWGPQPGQPGAAPNVPPTVHEAGGNAVGERDYNSNHHGQFHEMQG
ncbi:hypothetical protein F5Y07DRAFT_269548 [Xylaria sp. FL0933]|nr:hypothetical protein F5Y07DRAFT_269548 [Xylaria sp. FL0933]